MEDLMIKIDHVSKEYRLGVISSTTLVHDIQSKMAKLFGREDPNARKTVAEGNKNQRFKALDDISFEVKKGERVGIIGHNGAGKSTFLKLLSKVTAPTEGTIYHNGRVASMLEVGTGFHPEFTGRENVYMNGAILGMKKEEIDRKMDDIMKFAEIEKFIDTPVKRYSSGMYVKLAFSVAAHLDSEIMIMDEVLAVGDMNFQQKCIRKMREVADEGRTVLYVSHNMSTIRQLCNRCIVLSHGKVIFNGDVEEAIACYLSEAETKIANNVDFADMHDNARCRKQALLQSVQLEHQLGEDTQSIRVRLAVKSEISGKFLLKMRLVNRSEQPVGSMHVKPFDLPCGESELCFDMDLGGLCRGQYTVDLFLAEYEGGFQTQHDCVRKAFSFIVSINEFAYGIEWLPTRDGSAVLNAIDLIDVKRIENT